MKLEASPAEGGGVFPEVEQLRLWVTLYGQRLLRLAFTLLYDEYAAQDCVQEAFIKAGLKAHQLRNADDPFPWLAKIVLNECRVWLHRGRQKLKRMMGGLADANE